MQRKVKRYTEKILVRLDKATRLKLDQKSYDLEMNEAVYCRKAVEKCLKEDLINGR